MDQVVYRLYYFYLMCNGGLNIRDLMVKPQKREKSVFINVGYVVDQNIARKHGFVSIQEWIDDLI